MKFIELVRVEVIFQPSFLSEVDYSKQNKPKTWHGSGQKPHHNPMHHGSLTFKRPFFLETLGHHIIIYLSYTRGRCPIGKRHRVQPGS